MADPDSGAEIFDCATCTRPETHCEGCPIHDQPKALGYSRSLMVLDARMQRTGALPNAGGLLDQDERLMARLDMVARIKSEYRTEAGEGERD